MQIDFQEPWEAIKGRQEALRLEEEIYKEIASNSVLSNRKICAIARRIDCDDVLIAVPDNKTDIQIAMIHLTWSGKQETAPWPKVLFFTSWQEFVNKQMIPDATEYDS
jgi:hypothetical protein